MKKGLNCELTNDSAGNMMLIVRKERGKLTLDDIRAAATEYEQDYYALILKCMDGDMSQYWTDDLQGDAAELYPAADFLEVSGRAKVI